MAEECSSQARLDHNLLTKMTEDPSVLLSTFVHAHRQAAALSH